MPASRRGAAGAVRAEFSGKPDVCDRTQPLGDALLGFDLAGEHEDPKAGIADVGPPGVQGGAPRTFSLKLAKDSFSGLPLFGRVAAGRQPGRNSTGKRFGGGSFC